MKIASINISDYGSTGRIMLQLSEAVRKTGNDSKSYSRDWWGHKGVSGHVYSGYRVEHLLHHALGYLTGMEGGFSFFSTRELINQLKTFQPDIIHLHNLHGWYLDIKKLFDFIKQERIKTVWTMHDCWPFTGHCPYFDYVKCEKWTDHCHSCPLYRDYTESLTDNSARMFMKKKECFSGVADMTIVCPSQWLANNVKKSFLAGYDIRVIHNGIDTSVFRKRPSAFRREHSIQEDEKMVLGVASGWEERKGIDLFPVLSDLLGHGYKIVLVGIESKNRVNVRSMSDFVLLEKTSDQERLAEIYSAADVFVNPTREDNYPTVNLEAISCGTPVVTFDTGGCAETVFPGCGVVGDNNDSDAMADAVTKICKDGICDTGPYKTASESFSNDRMVEQYLSLYEEILSR